MSSVFVAITLFLSPASTCPEPLDRAAVIACAREHSPRVAAANARVDESRGTSDAARVLLPKNPVASVEVSHRWGPTGQRDVNVRGELSQEFEIGGQRRMRKDVARAGLERSERDRDGEVREAVAFALEAYYEALGAEAEAELLERARKTAEALVEVAKARSEAGLGSAVEVELAEVHRTRIAARATLARGRTRTATAMLAARLGLPATAEPTLAGSLDPLPVPNDIRTASEGAAARPEIAAADAGRREAAADTKLLERSRAPSTTLSFIAQRDGFSETVLGVGLALPIPLPAPLGQTNRGKIAASKARTRALGHEVVAIRRDVDVAVATAFYEYEARAAVVALHDDAAVDRALVTLEALAAEIAAGRFPVRDALVMQEAFIDFLVASAVARTALCLQSVELALASGIALEETR